MVRGRSPSNTRASVEVRRGIGEGLIAVTHSFGSYRLHGVSGEIELRVTKGGYEPAMQTVMVSDHQQRHDLELRLLGARQVVAGTYTLTIEAADHCRIGLPAEAWTRTYTATVLQDGPSLSVSLSGATFLPSQDRFPGRVEPGHAVFDFTWYDGERPLVVEKIPALGLLAIDGIAIVTGSGDRLAGPLNGAFRIFNSDTIRGSEVAAYCPSNDHTFVLSR